MSATRGTSGSCFRISANAAAASIEGTETRTMSAPAATQRWICATVAATSQVSVLVMVCTVIGASPPTWTLPTRILRVRRRLMGDSCMTLRPLSGG